MQLALSCVTRAVAILSTGGYRPAQTPHTLALGQGFATLRGGIAALLRVRMGYWLDTTDAHPPLWSARIASYDFALNAADGREIVAWHWHPQARGQIEEPHLHLGAGSGVSAALAKGHLPSGQVRLPSVVRYLIRDLGVRPLRAGWEPVLRQAEVTMAPP